MKKCTEVINLLLFLICFSATVFAQEKIITAKEFYDLRGEAYEKLEGKNYRAKRTKETFFNGKPIPDEVENSITESLLPDRSREFTETKTPAGITKEDVIYIGNKRYVKHNDKPWKLEQFGNGSGIGTGDSIDKNTYKFIETTTLNNQTVDVYEMSGINTAYFREDFVDSNQKLRYWINKDGLLVKSEFDDNIAAKNVRIKDITVYDYDAKIIIEMPLAKKRRGLKKR